jgi:UDP-N-acetylglucosamine--N-acetylmuramyl-(pentapeptide) pyrophosphoryl-undecaprenol N-acetylglucosamine transferase
MSNYKVVIVAGGTGGHLYPSMVIVDELTKRGVEVLLFIKRKINLEGITSAKIKQAEINIRGWDKKLVSLPFVIIPLLIAFFKSLYYLYKFSPTSVLAFGSYLSLPVGCAVYLLRIPLFIHEQNLVPGLANKILANIANKIMITFDKTREYIKQKYRNKVILVGLPIRKNISNVSKEEALRYFSFSQQYNTLLVFGGSQGAHNINLNVLNILPYLSNYQLIWITGKNDYEWILNKFSSLNLKNKDLIRIFDYIENMELTYSVADVVICRSGASTLAELTKCKLPAILIPYPYATDDHQAMNAYYLKAYKLAEVIPDKELTADRLITSITNLIKEKDRIKAYYTNNKLDLSAKIENIISLLI